MEELDDAAPIACRSGVPLKDPVEADDGVIEVKEDDGVLSDILTRFCGRGPCAEPRNLSPPANKDRRRAN